MKITTALKQSPENIETWKRAAQIVKTEGLDWTSAFYKANDEIRREDHPGVADLPVPAAPEFPLPSPSSRSWPTLLSLREHHETWPNHDLAAYLALHAEFTYMSESEVQKCKGELDSNNFTSFQTRVPLVSKLLALIPVTVLLALLVWITSWLARHIFPDALLASTLVLLPWCPGVLAVLSPLLLIYLLSQRFSTFGYGYRDLDRIVLAFRGTMNFSELLLTDGNILPWGWPCRHFGFLLAWSSIRDQVTSWLQSLDPQADSLILTGHSLGGALAQIAAFDLARQYPIDAVITFGAPRPGLFRFRDAYEVRTANPHFVGGKTLGGVTRRYTHGTDLVSRLPPPIPYLHVGREFYFDRNDEIQPGRPPYLIERIESAYNNLMGSLTYNLATFGTIQHGSPGGVSHGTPAVPRAQIHPLVRPFTQSVQMDRLGNAVNAFGSLSERLKQVIPYIAMIPFAVILGLISVALLFLTFADAFQHFMVKYLNAFGKRYNGPCPISLLAFLASRNAPLRPPPIVPDAHAADHP